MYRVPSRVDFAPFKVHWETFPSAIPTALSFFSLDPGGLYYVPIHKWERRTYQSSKYFSMVGATRMSKSLGKSRMMSFLCFYPQKTPMSCYNKAHCPELVQDVRFQSKVHESWTSPVSRQFFVLPRVCIPTAEHGLGKWESWNRKRLLKQTNLYVLPPDCTLWRQEMLGPDENSSSRHRECAGDNQTATRTVPSKWSRHKIVIKLWLAHVIQIQELVGRAENYILCRSTLQVGGWPEQWRFLEDLTTTRVLECAQWWGQTPHSSSKILGGQKDFLS